MNGGGMVFVLCGLASIWLGNFSIERLHISNFLLLSCATYGISHPMHWALAVLTLAVVGVVLRRLLRLDEPTPRGGGLLCLGYKREEVYQPFALEIQTQSVLLAISLNEALDQQKSGNLDKAWPHVRLAAGQWNRLADRVVHLLNTINQNLPNARSTLVVRNMDRLEFTSQTMAESAPLHILLDQLIFRSKVRYQVHIRVLRGGVEALAGDFREISEAIEARPEDSAAVWALLDPAFHDFDLIIKETLLYMRSFLAALEDTALATFVRELNAISQPSVRSASNLIFQGKNDN
jgi:hypothetical protein